MPGTWQRHSTYLLHSGRKLRTLLSLFLHLLNGGDEAHLTGSSHAATAMRGFVLSAGGLVTKSCTTLCDPLDCSPPGSSGPWDFPGQNIGVGCHFFLQGISLIQELNLGLLHCRQIFFLPIELRGKPRRSGQQQIHTRDGKSWDLFFSPVEKLRSAVRPGPRVRGVWVPWHVWGRQWWEERLQTKGELWFRQSGFKFWLPQ